MSTTTQSLCADWAHYYCEAHGLHLVPLPPRSKRPTAEDWGHKLLSDPDEARRWFEAHPDWNVGVALGPSRLCSLDVDDYEATQIICEEFGWSLDAIKAAAPTAQGQAPGLRIMFRVPAGLALKYHRLTWPSKLDPTGEKHRALLKLALEAKQAGDHALAETYKTSAQPFARFTVLELRVADTQQRQDVLPPSIHPDTQKPYTWLTEINGEFPAPPDFLVRLWENWEALAPQLLAACPWAPKSAPVVAKPRSTAVAGAGGVSVIDTYERSISITEALARYGYKRQGKRWLSPHSSTKLPGVVVFEADNRAFIHHASDPLCSVDSGSPVSPFDLYCYYEHGGDIKKAVRAAGDALGLPLQRRPSAPAPAPAQRYSQPAPTPAPAAYPSTFEVDDETGEIMAPQAANDNAPLALCSEDDLASGHLARMDGNTLWCEKWGTWLQWGRTRWQRDETLAVLDEVRHSMRIAARQVMASPDIKPDAQVRLAEKLCSHRVISNVEKLARLSRDVATHPDEWDADTMALNTPGGVVDLRTGIMRPHVRGDRMTKLTSVAPGGDCPTWHDFLHTATQGNGELIGFLRRMCGYALTGEIREHALFFVYGTGGNGKGTFLNTITHIMGDYQRVAGAETFTESHGDRHTTELARLQGARMVTAQETEEGKRWAEARIKALTGGDPITARFMRQDDFTYIPQFKLVIVGNHKPSFRNVDDAIRRRLHLIPFTFKASPDKIDPRLSEKLKAEASGILAWMIQGCIEWQQTGLRPPEIVKESTDEYLGGEDSLQQWLDDCCDLGMGFTTSKALFKSWSEWAENAGEFVGTMKRLMAKLESRGVSTGQKHRGMRGCNGIQLKQTY